MLSPACRKDDCERPRALHSVFCEEHHSLQLQQISAKIRTWRDRLARTWELHSRGVLSDIETIEAFLDGVDRHTIVEAFDSLPTDFQSLVADYLARTTIGDIRPCFLIGPGSDAGVRVATEERRANARALQERLRGV